MAGATLQHSPHAALGRFKASAALRARTALEQAVERAIAALDAFDGDADLEPALAVEEALDQRRWALAVGLGDDREDDDEREAVSEDEGAACEDEGHDSDHEPDETDLDYASVPFGAQSPRIDSSLGVNMHLLFGREPA